MSKVWFKPKRFGYGVSPASWEGWLIIALFCIALSADLALGPRLIPDPLAGRVVSLIGAGLLLALLAVVAARGEGEWRWRWGRDD